MFFLISNGYQSLVTSFMLNPLQQKTFKSIDEFVESEMKLIIAQKAEYIESFRYRKLIDSDPVIELKDIKNSEYLSKFSPKFLYTENVATLQSCRHLKNLIDTLGEDGKSYQEFYMIPEVFESSEFNLYTRPFHPYIDEVRKFSNKIKVWTLLILLLKIVVNSESIQALKINSFLKLRSKFLVSKNHGLVV